MTSSPAAGDTLLTHFQDTGRDPAYYDLIVTGDLGAVGKSVVMDFMSEAGYDMTKNYNDCGLIIFDGDRQDTHAGGSGCACAGLTFCGYLYRLLQRKQLNRVLLVATGALQSALSVQQGESMPGIAHAVSVTNR
ncbi:MAG: hypothetical protein ACI4QW_00845 [Clostridia bacterium]